MGQPFHFPLLAGWLSGETQVCVACVCMRGSSRSGLGGLTLSIVHGFRKYGRMAMLHKHYARIVPLRGGFAAGSKLYTHLLLSACWVCKVSSLSLIHI